MKGLYEKLKGELREGGFSMRDFLEQISILTAFLLMLGAVGNIESEPVVNRNSINIIVITLIYVIIFMAIKYFTEE